MYLGHGRDAVGSALVEVLESQGGVDTWGNILVRWDQDMREWLRGHGVRPPRHRLQLRALNLGADGKAWHANFPTVANCWKGAEVRLLIAFAARLTLAASGTGLRSQLVATCLWGLADFLHVLDIGDRHLSSEHAARAAYAGRAYLQCYHHLAALALEAGERRWKMRPKHHYFWHMVRASAWHPHAWSCFRFHVCLAHVPLAGASAHVCPAHAKVQSVGEHGVNPRFEHCFAQEDFVGVVAKLVRNSQNTADMLQPVQRHLVGCAVKWARAARRLEQGRWG